MMNQSYWSLQLDFGIDSTGPVGRRKGNDRTGKGNVIDDGTDNQDFCVS